MTIRVEVVYALPQRQWRVEVEIPEGATVAQALAVPAVQGMLRESNADISAVGVWGRAAKPDQPLRDRDRVEIYRPLLADPKTARRRRAVAERKARSG